MRNTLVVVLSVFAIAGCGSDNGQPGTPDVKLGTGGSKVTGTGGAQTGSGGSTGWDAAVGTGGDVGTGGATATGGTRTPDAPAATDGGVDGSAGTGGGPGLDATATGGVIGMDGSAGMDGKDAPLGMGGVGGCACTGGSTGNLDGGFARAGSMTSARTKHVATLLANGKVLITGGSSRGTASDTALVSAELFDPATGAFTATGNMTTARMGHTATLLPDGKVLVAGTAGSASAELFDPATGAFTATGNMIAAREEHTATLLDSGKVLIAGGFTSSGGLVGAELYDPATGTFTATGNLTEARYQHAAVLLASQKVLLVGGYVPPKDTGNNDGLTSAELYDPTTGTFAATGSMQSRRSSPTATLLSNGTVLVSGGPHGFEGYFASNLLELWDPATGKFASTGNMVDARTCHTATRLPTGVVLLAGGYQGGGGYGKYLASADLYSPSAGTCAAGVNLAEEREYHTATVLSDGSVLIAGGDSGGKSLSTAELYR